MSQKVRCRRHQPHLVVDVTYPGARSLEGLMVHHVPASCTRCSVGARRLPWSLGRRAVGADLYRERNQRYPRCKCVEQPYMGTACDT